MFFDDYLDTAAELDNLVSAYNESCNEYAGLIETLEAQRHEAQDAIQMSESLLNSIKRTPQEIAVELKELTTEVGKFKASSNNYIQAERDIKRGAAGIGVLAVGGIILTLCTRLKDFVAGIFLDKNRSIKSKFLTLLVTAAILAIPALILWFVVRYKIKKLQESIETITKEIGKVVTAIEGCKQFKETLAKRTAALLQRTVSLNSLRGCSFATLAEDEQYGLMSLVRETRALAKSINEVPEWL